MPIDESLPRYAGVAVAKNSILFELLANGEKAKAREHFNACAREAARLAGERVYFAADGTMMVTATGARSIFDDVDE